MDISKASGLAPTPYTYECSYFSWGNVFGFNPLDNLTFEYNWSHNNYDNTEGSHLVGNLDDQHDAARSLLGPGWKIPSANDVDELLRNCDYIDADGTVIESDSKVVVIDNTVGVLLRSKNNGVRLFFPCTGYGSGSDLLHSGMNGFFWLSSSLSDANAFRVVFGPYSIALGYTSRFFGLSVRPVFMR